MTNQTRIVTALEQAGCAMTDRELADATGLPEPSVRRTRLHLIASGTLVSVGADGDGRELWVVRKWWQHPQRYTGKQVLP